VVVHLIRAIPQVPSAVNPHIEEFHNIQ
jgi:hypothetical protein